MALTPRSEFRVACALDGLWPVQGYDAIVRRCDMIVLLTDFGHSEYVGVMKAVIANIAPDARIIDLCHTIAPQSIIEASWILFNNYRYFPSGTTFCCVVDPGVGTDRKAVAVKAGGYYFVAPDNGLLWEAVRAEGVIEIREIPIPHDASRTFHGRDVFAKAAANIEPGNFSKLGGRMERIAEFELYKHARQGIVVRIDSFANVVTNLEALHKQDYSVEIGGKRRRIRFCPDYSSAPAGDLFLIEGSNKTLEISIKDGRANDVLHLVAGTKIEIS